MYMRAHIYLPTTAKDLYNVLVELSMRIEFLAH